MDPLEEWANSMMEDDRKPAAAKTWPQSQIPPLNGNGHEAPRRQNSNTNSNTNDTSSHYEAVERILTMAEKRQDNENILHNHASGPLTPTEIANLSMLCSTASSNNDLGFADVDPDMMSQLVELLEQHISLAANVDLFKEAAKVIKSPGPHLSIDQWLQNEGFDHVMTLKLGLEAAGTVLYIMTSPGIDRRVVNEDAMEASITLLRQQLSKNILYSLNATGHMMQSSEALTSPVKKRRRSSAGSEQTVIRDWKKVYRIMMTTLGLTVVVMERLEAMVQKIPLDDQQVLTLSSGVMVTLELDPSTESGIKDAHQLHVATIGVLTSIFRKYPRHRSILVEDLFPIMHKMPASKKTLRMFPVQCSSVLYPSGLQTLSKSLAPQESQQAIQTMSAVIMAFVQSAVVRPTLETSEENGSVKLASGLQGCQAISDMVVAHLLQRCAKKGEDGGASEFRPILSNWIEDLLLLLLVPEYPAAEMILLSIANRLSRDLVQANGSSKALQATESTYLNTAFDAMGKICAAEARILASQRERPILLKVARKHSEDRRVECFCQKNAFTESLMLDCDHCHTWYHGDCVGLGRETVPEEWHCDACQLRRIVEFERDRYTNMGESGTAIASVDEEYCMRRLLVDYLSIVSRQNNHVGFRDAYEFHLARWLSELEKKPSPDGSDWTQLPLVSRLIEMWDPEESSHMSSTRGSQSLHGMLQCMSDEGRSRMMVHLASSQSSLLKSFRNQVHLIVSLMSSDVGAVLRKLAVKAIEKITDADPRLMLYPLIKKAVTKRFSDEAISVREAAVSLVGTYVVHTPAVANDFHASFLTGLHDAGVSVRKRTVKILQDILCSNPSYKGRATACSAMLKLAADPKEDDSLRSLIHDLFRKLWLENGEARVEEEVILSPAASAKSEEMTSPGAFVLDVEERPVNGGVVTPTPQPRVLTFEAPSTKSTRSTMRKIRTTQLRARSEIASEQMVEVVKAANTGDNLTVLFRGLLDGVNDVDKDRKKTERRQQKAMTLSHCGMLVDALFENLLSVEERRPKLGKDFGKELVATVRTIKVFTEVSPTVVQRHLDTLLPYLKADNKVSFEEDSAIVSAICDIITRLTMVFDAEQIQKLGPGSLGKDLVKVTYKFGPISTSSAVRALCSLAHHKDSGEESPFREKLLSLAKTFYKQLVKFQNEDDITKRGEIARAHVQRALSVLGSICRYHETGFEEVESESEDEADDKSKHPIEVTLSCLPALCERMFTRYLRKLDAPTKCAALRALSGVFIAHPRELFSMDQSGLITEVMSAETFPSLQIESLRCWRDILLAEEKRIESGEAKAKLDAKQGITVSKKVSGDQDGDATLFGGVLTGHSARLFEMTQCSDKQLRYTALDLIGHLLRQGQVNPMEAVPFLLALQGDIDEDDIRSLALKQLMIEGEKRPDMLRQRVCAGVRQAYAFQSSVYPEKHEPSALIKKARNGLVYTECVFGSVFRECIISIKKQRLGLFRNLLSLFDIQDRRRFENSRKSKSEEDDLGPVDIPLLCFTAQVLAHLPYNVASDPLYIIHNITSNVALQGADLSDRLAAFLRPYGLSSGDVLDEANAGEDDLERAAKRTGPNRAKEASPLLQPGFDLKSFADMCIEAASISLLLRLKAFLRTAYSLNEARILGYDPDAKERVADKAISKASTMLFDSSIPLTCSSSDKSDANMDALILQYSEFRRLMRIENSSEESMSDLEDESPNAGKRKRDSDEEEE